MESWHNFCFKTSNVSAIRHLVLDLILDDVFDAGIALLKVFDIADLIEEYENENELGDLKIPILASLSRLFYTATTTQKYCRTVLFWGCSC